MKEFVSIIMIDDLTKRAWESLSMRLCEEIETKATQHKERYKMQNQKINEEKKQIKKAFKKIPFDNQKFDGLINFIRKTASIKEEIDISCSSKYSDSKDPWNVIEYEQSQKTFCTSNSENEWLCIEFKKHTIKPTNYTIKSGNDNDNIKSFVLEISNDNQKWEIIDERNNCSSLKQDYSIKSFSISKEKQQ